MTIFTADVKMIKWHNNYNVLILHMHAHISMT